MAFPEAIVSSNKSIFWKLSGVKDYIHHCIHFKRVVGKDNPSDFGVDLLKSFGGQRMKNIDVFNCHLKISYLPVQQHTERQPPTAN